MAKDKRFVNVYTQPTPGCLEIWVDTETSVQYAYTRSASVCGLTVLVDAEGKPLLYKGERQKSSPEL